MRLGFEWAGGWLDDGIVGLGWAGCEVVAIATATATATATGAGAGAGAGGMCDRGAMWRHRRVTERAS